MKITEMTITEMIKLSCLRLLGLMLITIPLIACYPVMVLLGLPERLSTIATVCLTVAAYFLLIARIEPFLHRFLPFASDKVKENLQENRHKRIEHKKVIS